MAKKITSPAKIQVIAFVKDTEPGVNEYYEFELEGNEDDANKFIHQMRVELSRMRNYVKSKGRRIKAWKMLQESIKPHPDKEGFVVIKLRRTITSTQRVANEVDDILSEIEGGEILNVS